MAPAFLHWLKREFGPAPTAAVGYSLGGNMLGCLLAEEGDRCPLDAAVIVSAPFMLEACSYHMDKGFSRVYQRYLLNLLKANASRKLKAYPGSLPVDLRQLKGMRRIREFDDMITAKIHGFADALDYYRQCSAMPRLSDITKPTLIIHAKERSVYGSPLYSAAGATARERRVSIDRARRPRWFCQRHSA